MRHTSAVRYSNDDPAATVIVVSEDGPVTVLRAGKRVGASLAERLRPDDVDVPDAPVVDATEVA